MKMGKERERCELREMKKDDDDDDEHTTTSTTATTAGRKFTRRGRDVDGKS